MEKNRGWFDEALYLRGIAATCVLVTHAWGQTVNHASLLTPAYLIGVTTFILTKGFMTFMAVSGFVLTNKYAPDTNWMEFYTKRLRAVVPPYIAFSAINVVGLAWGTNDSHGLQRIIKAIAKGDSAAHMWFFVSIIQLYLLFPLIYKIYLWFESRQRAIWPVVISFALFALWIGLEAFVRVIGPDRGTHQGFDAAIEVLPPRVFLNGLPFFVMGIYARRHYEMIKEKVLRMSVPILFMAPFALAVTAALIEANRAATSLRGVYIEETPMALFISCLIKPLLIVLHFRLAIYLTMHPSFALAKMFRHIGGLSFGIFLIHVLVQVHVQRSLTSLGFAYDNILLYPVLFALTLCLSYGSVWLLSRLPYSEWYIGVKKPSLANERVVIRAAA